MKRAREALRVQRSAFQSRQRAWKQKSARATLEQLVQVDDLDEGEDDLEDIGICDSIFFFLRQI